MLNKSWWKQTSLVPDLKRKSVQSFTIEYDIFCGLYVYGIYYMKVISFCSYSVKKEGLFRKGCWIFNNIYLLVWLHQVLVAVRVLLWDLSCFLMSSFLDTDFLHCTTFAMALKSLYVVFLFSFVSECFSFPFSVLLWSLGLKVLLSFLSFVNFWVSVLLLISI